MFSRSDMTVMDWYLFWILMAIPFVNIIVLILIMLSPGTNGTLRSMLWAQAILAILVTILFMTVLQPYMRNIWDFLTQMYPFNQFF